MAAPKGNKFTTGRKKGGGNKTTIATKEFVLKFCEDKQADIDVAWEKLEPLDKVKQWTALLRHVLPTLSSVKVEDSNGDDVLESFLKKEK